MTCKRKSCENILYNQIPWYIKHRPAIPHAERILATDCRLLSLPRQPFDIKK